MAKKKIFISSVQTEFAEARSALHEYISADPSPRWTTQKLKQLHTSVPANPLLAEPMYLAGYFERLGTGTADMVRVAVTAGLHEPEFVQTDEFKAIIYRPVSASLPGKKHASNRQVTGK